MYIPLAQLCLEVRGTLASWKMGALALRQTPGTPPVYKYIGNLLMDDLNLSMNYDLKCTGKKNLSSATTGSDLV